MAGRLGRRLTAHVDERTQDLHEHLDIAVEHHIGPRIDQRVDRVEDRVSDIQQRLAALEASVAVDVQTASEAAVTARRSTERTAQALDDLLRMLTASDDPSLPALLRRSLDGDPHAEVELARLITRLVPGAADRVAGELVGVQEGEVGPGVAQLLNWAAGHTGPAAQAGAWFNPAVTVLHADGTVRTNEVNERIVEVPYALGAVASLPPGSRVLDFGAAESTLALSLASLGIEVLAADLRHYPFGHPSLEPVVGPIESWEGPAEPLDAVLCVSALEHVGLGAYDEERTEGDLDRRILSRFGTWLRPGGEVVFTAPFGTWAVDDLQRTYDAEHLDALFEGWTILDRRICAQTGPATWEPVGDGTDPPASTWEDGTRGVVLLRATPSS